MYYTTIHTNHYATKLLVSIVTFTGITCTASARNNKLMTEFNKIEYKAPGHKIIHIHIPPHWLTIVHEFVQNCSSKNSHFQHFSHMWESLLGLNEWWHHHRHVSACPSNSTAEQSSRWEAGERILDFSEFSVALLCVQDQNVSWFHVTYWLLLLFQLFYHFTLISC